jgi:hypothetical protein
MCWSPGGHLSVCVCLHQPAEKLPTHCHPCAGPQVDNCQYAYASISLRHHRYTKQGTSLLCFDAPAQICDMYSDVVECARTNMRHPKPAWKFFEYSTDGDLHLNLVAPLRAVRW